jgi:hypothetical protein
MTLSLLFGGSSKYRLVHADLDVGWLAGDSLVFTGFDSLAQAERAGDAGYIALLEWLASRGHTTGENEMALHVAIGEDNMSEWIGPNGKVLARIFRPAEDEGFVVEFTLPPRVHTVAAARAASRIFEAMQTTMHDAWPHPTRGEHRKTLAKAEAKSESLTVGKGRNT